ncbi:MAG: CAP domain-containing protein [Kofleriaceae bacterium]
MRASLVILSLAAACGPIYPQQQPPPPQQALPMAPGPSAPPGGSDPWAESRPAPDHARPEPPPREQPRPPPAGAVPAGMQGILDAHNQMRAKHCAVPLVWSPKLEAYAQRWANSLRDRGCKFEHSSGNKFGENLAGATTGILDGAEVTKMWYDEVKLYDFRSGGFSMETGHFTQLVWRDTTQVGCARSTCNGLDLWVCEYDPPGNVQTQYQAKVAPTSCR